MIRGYIVDNFLTIICHFSISFLLTELLCYLYNLPGRKEQLIAVRSFQIGSFIVTEFRESWGREETASFHLATFFFDSASTNISTYYSVYIYFYDCTLIRLFYRFCRRYRYSFIIIDSPIAFLLCWLFVDDTVQRGGTHETSVKRENKRNVAFVSSSLP